jgi:hypothetical protein
MTSKMPKYVQRLVTRAKLLVLCAWVIFNREKRCGVCLATTFSIGSALILGSAKACSVLFAVRLSAELMPVGCLTMPGVPGPLTNKLLIQMTLQMNIMPSVSIEEVRTDANLAVGLSSQSCLISYNSTFSQVFHVARLVYVSSA